MKLDDDSLRSLHESTGQALARDLRLLRRWRNGDATSGTELLSHYKALFYRVCIRLGVRDEEQIVEIYQDLVLDVLRALPNLPEQITSSFAGWFAWRTRDAATRRRARVEAIELPAHLESQECAPSFETWEAIRACWGKLPPSEHKIFELRYLHGLSLKETADATHSNSNAVGQAIFRLSRKMQICLEAAGFGPSTDFGGQS